MKGVIPRTCWKGPGSLQSPVENCRMPLTMATGLANDSGAHGLSRGRCIAELRSWRLT